MEATVIPLNNWQDPQGDIVLIYSEHECSVFFGCWTASGEPADYIGHLSFERASSVRSFRRESVPYHVPEHTQHSYILRIPESDMQRDSAIRREQYYPRSSHVPSDQSHFVVMGHDIYHEILAAGFSETAIPASALTDARLLALNRNG